MSLFDQAGSRFIRYLQIDKKNLYYGYQVEQSSM